ncbi:hypothetical protein E3N88_09406 [Mikania micrantha]|uniref:Uncharacterized protein n=1 Tax=Mikania micrantha TaxID=192012 RepID=A0A5N6PIY4_9ASTR|nr:hypothetical protein E3N88_09406 [Mikania micrantha]
MDMCSINPAYLGKKYRYAYACGAQRPCNFPNTITKIDLEQKKAKNWYEEGSVPSEPFFVARPGAKKEDDGVVISMVSDKNGEGYALMLDASTFQEIARAKFPYGLPYGLHGCWDISSSSEIEPEEIETVPILSSSSPMQFFFVDLSVMF